MWFGTGSNPEILDISGWAQTFQPSKIVHSWKGTYFRDFGQMFFCNTYPCCFSELIVLETFLFCIHSPFINRYLTLLMFWDPLVLFSKGARFPSFPLLQGRINPGRIVSLSVCVFVPLGPSLFARRSLAYGAGVRR